MSPLRHPSCVLSGGRSRSWNSHRRGDVWAARALLRASSAAACNGSSSGSSSGIYSGRSGNRSGSGDSGELGRGHVNVGGSGGSRHRAAGPAHGGSGGSGGMVAAQPGKRAARASTQGCSETARARPWASHRAATRRLGWGGAASHLTRHVYWRRLLNFGCATPSVFLDRQSFRRDNSGRPRCSCCP